MENTIFSTVIQSMLFTSLSAAVGAAVAFWLSRRRTTTTSNGQEREDLNAWPRAGATIGLWVSSSRISGVLVAVGVSWFAIQFQALGTEVFRLRSAVVTLREEVSAERGKSISDFAARVSDYRGHIQTAFIGCEHCTQIEALLKALDSQAAEALKSGPFQVTWIAATGADTSEIQRAQTTRPWLKCLRLRADASPERVASLRGSVFADARGSGWVSEGAAYLPELYHFQVSNDESRVRTRLAFYEGLATTSDACSSNRQ